MLNKARKLASLALLVCSFTALNGVNAAVWENENEWNAEWDKKYAQWVELEFKKDIFSNPESPYYGIKTDCADAAYTMRAIFAYENKLPFVMNCPWTNSSTCTVSNSTSKYDSTADSYRRFVRFNNAIHNIASSRIIRTDTYPPKVNREDLRAGSIYLQANKHVYEMKMFADAGYGVFMWSTTPRIVRELSTSTSVPDLYDAPSGFRMWKNPADLKKSVAQMRSEGKWSNEQHEEVFTNLNRKDSALKERMKVRGHQETKKDIAKRVLADLISYAKDRVTAVNAGYEYCSVNSCDAANVYDLYSTPSRDSKLLGKFEAYITAQTIVEEDSYFASSPKKILKKKKIEYTDGEKINLYKVYTLLKAGKFSSDPRDSVAKRWGQE